MSINATLIAQMLAFLFLIWFTMKYIWPPLLAAMHERDKKIADGLAAADQGHQALKEAAAKREEALAQARGEAQEILGSANKQASQIVEEARTAAKTEGERIKQQAQAEIEQEINRARDSLRKDVAALAVSGAAQILGREIDSAAHGELLDRLAGQI